MVDRLRGKCCSFLVLLDGTVTLRARFKCNIITPVRYIPPRLAVENFFSVGTYLTIIKTEGLKKNTHHNLSFKKEEEGLGLLSTVHASMVA